MTIGYWRSRARPIVAQVIEEVGAEDMVLLRKKLSMAYPFGQKKYYPYDVWLDEIKTQLGIKKPKKPKNPDQLLLIQYENDSGFKSI